jgi:hypothetical protein
MGSINFIFMDVGITFMLVHTVLLFIFFRVFARDVSCVLIDHAHHQIISSYWMKFLWYPELSRSIIWPITSRDFDNSSKISRCRQWVISTSIYACIRVFWFLTKHWTVKLFLKLNFCSRRLFLKNTLIKMACAQKLKRNL